MHQLRKLFSLGICALTLLATACAMAATPPPGASVQPPEKVGVPGANESVTIRLPDGELRVFYILRPSGTELRSMGSTDNGRTWSEGRTEIVLPGTAYYAVQVTLDRHGEYQVVFHILGKGDNGYNGRHYDVWHMKSSDQRTRWGEPRRIYDGYVGSLRGFTTLKNGRLVLPLSIAVPARSKPVAGDPDYGWHDVVVFTSDDDGVTWNQGSDRLRVPQDEARGRTRYGAVEPHTRELLDGRVWMLIRTKNGHLWESFSTDGGTTWPQPTRSRFIASDSPAATTRLKDNRLVLLLNSCQKWDELKNYAIGGRHVLHAAISGDDGKTWSGFREILRDDQAQERGDRGTAYASCVETADGKVLVASGQGEGKKALLLIDPAWLEAKSASDDFAGGDANWTHYEGKGASIVAHPDDASKKALEIRKSDPAFAAGAIWNFPATPSGKMSLRLFPRSGMREAKLALTDHYCVISDTLAEQNGIYTLDLAPHLASDAWHDVELNWSAEGPLKLSVNGRSVAEVPAQRKSDFGPNYLRLKSFDEAGFIIAGVSSSSN